MIAFLLAGEDPETTAPAVPEIAQRALDDGQFGILVMGLGMVLFCVACAMVASWAR